MLYLCKNSQIIIIRTIKLINEICDEKSTKLINEIRDENFDENDAIST